MRDCVDEARVPIQPECRRLPLELAAEVAAPHDDQPDRRSRRPCSRDRLEEVREALPGDETADAEHEHLVGPDPEIRANLGRRYGIRSEALRVDPVREQARRIRRYPELSRAVEDVGARGRHEIGPVQRLQSRPADQPRALGERDVGAVQADDERDPTLRAHPRRDGPVGHDPVGVDDVELPRWTSASSTSLSADRKTTGASAYSGHLILSPACERLRVPPWRPGSPRRVAVRVEVDSAFDPGPAPLAMLRDDEVHLVAQCCHVARDRLDERRRRVARELRVRRRESEDLQPATWPARGSAQDVLDHESARVALVHALLVLRGDELGEQPERDELDPDDDEQDAEGEQRAMPDRRRRRS